MQSAAFSASDSSSSSRTDSRYRHICLPCTTLAKFDHISTGSTASANTGTAACAGCFDRTITKIKA
ncbi:hypothetical protein CG447_02740 [Faecalibacterium duncaniae]|nr:hypothetical protein CG447_02740 [Faecalibacterium duncaniae]